MAISGDLSEFSLPELFQILDRGSKSGRLVISTPNGAYSVWLYQGRIIAASAPNDQCSLHHLLPSAGIITERVAQKLGSLCPVNEPLGVCLKRQGLLAPNQLANLFRKQLQVGVYRLFELAEGKFRFDAGAELPYSGMTGMSKGALDVAIEAMRHVHVSSSKVMDLPHADTTICRTSLELPMVKLSSLEWSIVEISVQPRSIKDIRGSLNEDLLEIRKACTRLLQFGLIEEVAEFDHQAMTEPVLDVFRGRSNGHHLDTKGVSPAITGQSHPALCKMSVASGSSDSRQSHSAQEPVSPSLLNRLMAVLRGMHQ